MDESDWPPGPVTENETPREDIEAWRQHHPQVMELLRQSPLATSASHGAQQGDYPQSEPSSQPRSPPSRHRNSICSDGSSPSEPPSFVRDGIRLCWNSSNGLANEEDLALQFPQQQLGPVATAAQNLAASAIANRSSQFEVPPSWTSSAEVEEVGEVHIRTASADAEGHRLAPRAWPHERSDRLGRLPQASGVAYPLESASDAEVTMDEPCTMTYDECEHWPMGGHETVHDGEEGPNNRACDMVLNPFSGPASVVRGAQALAEAQRLAALHGSSGDDSLDTTCEELESPLGPSLFTENDPGCPPKLPTAADLRRGLGELRKMSAKLEEERRSRLECGQGQQAAASEIEELQQKLEQAQVEGVGLRAQVAYSQSVERRCATAVTDLKTELNQERNRNREQKERVELLEAAFEEQVAMASTIHTEFSSEFHAESEARANSSMEIGRLVAALGVANGQEAAATAVATTLRAEVIEAQRRVREVECNSGDTGERALFEKERAAWDAEKAELIASLDSAQQFEAHEVATVARLRSARDNLRTELISERATAEAFRQSRTAQPHNDAKHADVFSVSLQAVQREHELQYAVAASEHQRELDRVRLESENHQLCNRAEFLSHELEMARKRSAESQQRFLDAEADAARLLCENRKLQNEVFSEFSAAAAAAREASVAASAAASSAAAIEERNRASPVPKQGREILDSPVSSALPVNRRLLHNLDTPETQSSVATLLRSRRLLSSSSSKTFERLERSSSSGRGGNLRLLNAGDVAAGGAPKHAPSACVRSQSSEALSLNVELEECVKHDTRSRKEEPEEAEDDEVYSPLSKPFLGGPLGLARALAMRSAPRNSRSRCARN